MSRQPKNTAETYQRTQLREILQRELRTKRPTIYLVMEYNTGRGLPTSWTSAYIMQDKVMKRLWAPWRMRRRRTDNNMYWHEHSWGTAHTFLVVEQILYAADLHHRYDGNAFRTEVL